MPGQETNKSNLGMYSRSFINNFMLNVLIRIASLESNIFFDKRRRFS